MNSFFAKSRDKVTMMRPRYYIAHLFGFTALFLSVISGPGAAGQTTDPVKIKSITLGLVSATSQKEIEARFQNFVRYERRLVRKRSATFLPLAMSMS
jgi:hypothetical protein